MTLLRRLSYATLVLAFAQIVFGAIVRITGSGLGCGNHWPKCNGEWFPPHDRINLIIEITHRYIAATLTLAILVLLVAAIMRRREIGVDRVLRPVLLAVGLVLTAAVFGAVTVKMDLNPYIIVTHLSIAMTLLAVLAVAAMRAGGFGLGASGVGEHGDTSALSLKNVRSGASMLPHSALASTGASAKTYRAARAAAVMAFLALVFGALTANVAGANNSCRGFPWCTSVEVHGVPLSIQIVHRLLAFVLLLHIFGMVMAVRKRGESELIQRAIRLAFAAVCVQIFVAAMLVELHLPAVWRSLHQAMGTLVWLAIFTMTALARYTMVGGLGDTASLRTESDVSPFDSAAAR